MTIATRANRVTTIAVIMPALTIVAPDSQLIGAAVIGWQYGITSSIVSEWLTSVTISV